MPPENRYVLSLLSRLKGYRVNAGLSAKQLEEKLLLGPGWVSSYENGEVIPDIQTLLALLSALGRTLSELVQGIQPPRGGVQDVQRHISAEQQEMNLIISFAYADHDATYILAGATKQQYDQVIRTLRNGLARLAKPEEIQAQIATPELARLAAAEGSQAEAIKTEAVAKAYLTAVQQWPQANPSDLWWFLVSRAYCDPFNHPSNYARLDFQQSWKRTGGWALEQVLVRHYGPQLMQRGINLFIATTAEKEQLLKAARVSDRLEADKADVLLTGDTAKGPRFFGVVHVKASFAERRTDDVPMSRALIRAGYSSPLWTMDCKSTPGINPVNRGELGRALEPGVDKRSAKRKDIENDGYFSGCFSYNSNTIPTPPRQKCRARINVCSFTNPDDSFSRFIVAEWQRVRRR